MTQKPIDPPKQTTPANKSEKNKLGNFGGGTSNNINISESSSIDRNLLQQILEELSDADSNPESDVPIPVEISPADIASVPPGSFLSISSPLIAGLIDFQLPANFTYTLSPESAGKYGTVITGNTGEQSVTVNINIENVDGIIDYEVRLIKND